MQELRKLITPQELALRNLTIRPDLTPGQLLTRFVSFTNFSWLRWSSLAENLRRKGFNPDS